MPALLRIIGEKKRAVDVDSRSALRDREKSELVDFRCVAYLKRLVPYYLTSSLNTCPNENVVAAKTYY